MLDLRVSQALCERCSISDAGLGEAYEYSESDFPKGPMCDCRRDMKKAKQDRSGFAEGRVSRW